MVFRHQDGDFCFFILICLFAEPQELDARDGGVGWTKKWNPLRGLNMTISPPILLAERVWQIESPSPVP